MPDIFSEVDEEVRRERLTRLWRRFGPWLIAALVLFIAGVAGKLYWDHWREGQRRAESDRYQSALRQLNQGETDAALVTLKDLAEDSNFGYGMLARLQIASSLAREGKRQDALRVFDELAADDSINQRYRDYAALMAATLTIDEQAFDDALARLQPLMNAGAPWEFSARELYGTTLYLKGDYQSATKIFSDLLQGENTPPDMASRAKEMLMVLETVQPVAGTQSDLVDPAKKSGTGLAKEQKRTQ